MANSEKIVKSADQFRDGNNSKEQFE